MPVLNQYWKWTKLVLILTTSKWRKKKKNWCSTSVSGFHSTDCVLNRHRHLYRKSEMGLESSTLFISIYGLTSVDNDHMTLCVFYVQCPLQNWAELLLNQVYVTTITSVIADCYPGLVLRWKCLFTVHKISYSQTTRIMAWSGLVYYMLYQEHMKNISSPCSWLYN